MTSPVETASRLVRPRADGRWALREAMLAERQAYESMRALVPELALPRERRGSLSALQQASVDDHQRLREQVEALRSDRRSPGLQVLDDQSL
jgi:hypothetical protein